MTMASTAIQFDWTINVGNVLTVLGTLLGFGLGALGLYYGLKGNVNKLAYIIDVHGGRLINVENEVRALREIITTVSVQHQQIEELRRRLDGMQSASDESRSRIWAKIDELDERTRLVKRGA